ncbi:MAG: glycosyltransferase family 2 protein [Oligoflexia bacterium]|nr:glycosyltransferase family 2 protein [Oligoflexia bacterium]
MKLSIVIPCYNEKPTVQKLLTLVTNAPYPDGISHTEILVIDDCSRDGTRELVQKICNSPESEIALKKNQTIRLILQEQNGGKGSAIRKGFHEASGDIILIQDADLEYDPEDYPALLNPILKGYADAVFGSRFIGLERRVLYYHHSLINKFLTFVSNVFTNLNLTDMETCYKVFRTPLLKNMRLESNRFGIEPELTAKVAKLKVRVFEVGIRYHGRTYEEGKKITWKDGIAALWHIIRFNLFP